MVHLFDRALEQLSCSNGGCLTDERPKEIVSD
jgi:hypothetical protein